MALLLSMQMALKNGESMGNCIDWMALLLSMQMAHSHGGSVIKKSPMRLKHG